LGRRKQKKKPRLYAERRHPMQIPQGAERVREERREERANRMEDQKTAGEERSKRERGQQKKTRREAQQRKGNRSTQSKAAPTFSNNLGKSSVFTEKGPASKTKYIRDQIGGRRRAQCSLFIVLPCAPTDSGK